MSLADRMADQAQYSHIIESTCDTCARKFQNRVLTCEAFPAGIPVPIWMGKWDHRVPYDLFGQTDRGLTYVPREGGSEPPTLFPLKL